jgi:hypothetical protein
VPLWLRFYWVPLRAPLSLDSVDKPSSGRFYRCHKGLGSLSRATTGAVGFILGGQTELEAVHTNAATGRAHAVCTVHMTEGVAGPPPTPATRARTHSHVHAHTHTRTHAHTHTRTSPSLQAFAVLVGPLSRCWWGRFRGAGWALSGARAASCRGLARRKHSHQLQEHDGHCAGAAPIPSS